jgi:sec-independent protein translocase protein TatA
MSLGAGEIAIIFVLVLVLFGPQRLPELARGLGKGMRELRKATAEIQQQLSLIGEYDETGPKQRQQPLNSQIPSAAEAYEASNEDGDESGDNAETAPGVAGVMDVEDRSGVTQARNIQSRREDGATFDT